MQQGVTNVWSKRASIFFGGKKRPYLLRHLQSLNYTMFTYQAALYVDISHYKRSRYFHSENLKRYSFVFFLKNFTFLNDQNFQIYCGNFSTDELKMSDQQKSFFC